MSYKIVVTGAAGFIGRNVVAELNARGCDDLLLVDNLGCDGKWRNLVGLLYEDILDSQQFLDRLEKGAMPSIDAVIHLGACSATTEKDAGYLLRNNYQFTRRLCEWCLVHKARFVYASSAATYGNGDRGYDEDVNNLELLRPLNMYGYSKHLFDLWANRHGLFNHIVGLKYFNVYGPYEDHKEEMRSVVHKSFQQISRTGVVTLFKSYRPEYADGKQLRDFIFVKDAVAMTLFFIENRSVSGLFNCGTGQARSWIDLANAVFSAMGLSPSIEFIEMPEQLRGKYQYFTQAQMTKMRAAGYLSLFTSLEDGVRDYVTNHLVNSPTKQ